MDKKALNNEIIWCRPAVRKARVVVIRKLLKKMKILKSCKVEAVKDKKLKKAERLFEKVKILKKIKDDDVTKFALKSKDLDIFIRGPKFDLRENALASLATHESVVKHVNAIRERMPNWEVELPILLNLLGKKKQKQTKTNRNMEKVKKNELVLRKPLENLKEPKKKSKRSDNGSSSEVSACSVSEKEEKLEKIVDPFFIEKQVIAPKSVLERLNCGGKSTYVNKLEKPRLLKKANVFHKTFEAKESCERRPRKSLPKEKEETLHPSWAAKKVILFKPFQGKKIVFSDD